MTSTNWYKTHNIIRYFSPCPKLGWSPSIIIVLIAPQSICKCLRCITNCFSIARMNQMKKQLQIYRATDRGVPAGMGGGWGVVLRAQLSRPWHSSTVTWPKNHNKSAEKSTENTLPTTMKISINNTNRIRLYEWVPVSSTAPPLPLLVLVWPAPGLAHY